MEHFVFPVEIKSKQMKMSRLMNNFLRPIKLCEIAAKLYYFLLTSVPLLNFHINFSGSKHGNNKLQRASFSMLVIGLSCAKGYIKF